MNDKSHIESGNNNQSDKKNKELEMILRRYNTLIFDPQKKDLDIPLPEEIDKLMEKTKNIRPSVQKKSFLTLNLFAYAASIALVGVLAFHLFSPKNSGISPKKHSDFQNTVRGNTQRSVGIPVVGAKKEDALAYLVDISGKIKIKTGKKDRIPSSCEILYNDDIVILASGASAKIMYQDALFNIVGPKQYRIQNPNPVIIQSGTTRGQQNVDPVMTTRGNHLVRNIRNIIMPPRTLLASAVAPITRAGESINVFSPKGASYTNKPIIKIGGNPKLTYIVSVLDIEGTVIGKSIVIPGGAQRSWSDISQSPIVEDEIYTLRVQLNGKIVNDTNNASFWLLSSEEKESVSVVLKYVSSIKSVQEKQFFQANTLYMNGCYSEAFLLLENASQSENNLIQQLLKLCKISLKIQEK